MYQQHAIVQAFYYDALEPHERQALHLRAAEHHEAAEPDLVRAARHYLYAGKHVRGRRS